MVGPFQYWLSKCVGWWDDIHTKNRTDKNTAKCPLGRNRVNSSTFRRPNSTEKNISTNSMEKCLEFNFPQKWKNTLSYLILQEQMNSFT